MPARTARVRIACRSVPQSGSVRARPPRSSPVAKRGRYAALLLLGADALHAGRHDQVRVEDAGERHPHLRDLLHDAWRRWWRRARARRSSVRDGGAEQPQRLHLLHHLGRVDVGVLQLAARAAARPAPATCRPHRESRRLLRGLRPALANTPTVDLARSSRRQAPGCLTPQPRGRRRPSSISSCRMSLKRLKAPHSAVRQVISTICASVKCCLRRVNISSRVRFQLLVTAIAYSTTSLSTSSSSGWSL